MRVWNDVRLVTPTCVVLVLELPMRVWNYVNSLRFCVLISVLELPMRVWNRRTQAQGAQSPDSFGVTYEGLKHLRVLVIQLRLEGFGVTYEGLKLVRHNQRRMIQSSFWSYLWGFETELIAEILNGLLVLFWSYLWGFETWECSENERREVWFWSYLWGFETDRRRYATGTLGRFWSYLWGFETPILHCRQYSPVDSFGVTYEGLKPSRLPLSPTCPYRFGVTYEGLKPYIR